MSEAQLLGIPLLLMGIGIMAWSLLAAYKGRKDERRALFEMAEQLDRRRREKDAID